MIKPIVVATRPATRPSRRDTPVAETSSEQHIPAKIIGPKWKHTYVRHLVDIYIIRLFDGICLLQSAGLRVFSGNDRRLC